MTTLQIINWFRSIVMDQPGFSDTPGAELGSFTTGESLALNSVASAPLVWLERPFQTSITLAPYPLDVKYLLQFQVLDQELSEGLNRDAVLSRCMAIGVSIIASIYENKPPGVIELPADQVVDTVELWRAGADLWVGVRFELEIKVRPTTNGCDVRR
jgi:hypothetical protein